MTVKELIEKLEKMRPDAIVAIDAERYLDKPLVVTKVKQGDYEDHLVVIEHG